MREQEWPVEQTRSPRPHAVMWAEEMAKDELNLALIRVPRLSRREARRGGRRGGGEVEERWKVNACFNESPEIVLVA